MPFLDVSRKLPQIGTTSSATAVPEFSIHSIQVMVIKGDITKDSSDAIVNTTSSEINLSSSGQVSAALLKIAGSKLQDLCTAAVKSEGQLTEGNVISTTAPKPLSCTSIFHIYFRSNDSAMYEATIEACLKKAEQLQYRTIAFPAIGTGAQKYPSSQAAKGILEGVKKFALSGPRNLKEVRLVIYQQSVYDDFVAITTGQQEHETLSEYDSDKSLLYDSDSSQSDTEILSGSISDETRKSEDSKSTPVGESNWLVKTFSNLLPSTPWTESDTSKVTKATQDPFARGLKLKIYGFDQKQVDIAAKRLMEIMKENFDSARIEDQIISSLNQEDCDKIHTECRALGVECRIERDIGSIHISGNVQDIHKIKDVVHALLRKVMSRKTKEQRQELQRGYEIDGCFNRVKWQYMGLNQGKHKFEDYDKEVSYDIEQAFKLFEADGQKYRFNYSRVPFNFRVDFKNHEEKDRKTNARRRVRRYDVMHEAARIGKRPDKWEHMAQEVKVATFDLKPSSHEYKKVLETFETTMQKGMNYTSIVKIQRVQNPGLYAIYQEKKMLMEQVNPPDIKNERQLFHGTDAESAMKINTQGFNRTYAGKHAKAFGVGTYFARDASYSARPTYSTPDGNGHRYMYLALVLVGEFTVGSSNMLVPPAKDAAKDPNTPFDSLVNDTSNPSIFVIGPDAQSYPEYLIIFK